MSRAWIDPLDSSLWIDRGDGAVRFAGAGKMVRGLPLNKALVVIGVLLVTVLAALFAIPALVDWSRYRGGFEEQASRLLGRSVRVGEHVRLRLLPTPYISFDNVRVADASGRFDTPLLRMESFRLQLAVAPLLTGSLVAQDVELMAPALRLAVGPDGRGNWMGLGRSAAGSAAGDLRGLALNAVHIDRGTVELIDASGKQTLRLEGITGDLEAPTLQGPYSFKGGLAQAGKPSELKFWAGRQGAAGEISLKSQWRIGGDRGRSYTFDGNLKGLEAVPTVTGALDGRIGFVPDAQPGAVGRPGVASLDFKAKVLATMDSATLGDLDVTFDGGARPQHATGTAVLGWRDGLPTEADLTAVALDFDQIAGMTARPAPLRTIQALVGELGGALGNDTDAHVRLSVQDATLGGASIGDLKLAARYSGLGLAIESLSAKLPGQSRLDASGDLTAGASARFEGKVRLWGANIAALSNWAAPELRLANAGGVSSFLVDSAVIADSEHFQANSMRMEISGTTVTGSVRYGATEPRSLSLTLDSGRLDLTRLFETPLSLAALEGASPQPGDGAAEPGNDVWHALRSMFSGDTHLDLRIGHLITAQGSLRDVSAKLDRSNGRLNIPAIDLATDDGFELHVEGALQAKDAEGQGQLRLHVAAPDDKAIASAVRFAGVGDGLAGLQKPLAAMTPLSLAGTIVVGMNSATSQELALDGMANGSHLTVSLRRDEQDADWLASQVDVSADLASVDSGRLLTQIAQALGSVEITPPRNTPGRLVLRASGVPGTGMIISAALEAAPTAARFDGTATLGADTGLGLDGLVGIDTDDAGAALRVAHLDGLARGLQGALRFSGRLHRDGQVLTVADLTATLAGETVAGDATLTAATPVARLQARLHVPTLRLDRLLASMVLAPGERATKPDQSGLDGSTQTPLWSDQPFNFGATQGFEAKLDATAARLVLADGFAVSDATVDLSSRPGAIEFDLRQGRAAGGDVTAHVTLAKGAAGATLRLQAGLAKGHLDAMGSQSSGLPRPGGELGLTLALEGTGLTPSDIVKLAVGKGSFSLADGDIAQFSPGSIDAAARAVLADPAAGSETAGRLLAQTRLFGDFPMHGASGALTVGDGAVRFDRLKVASTRSELEIANRIDLATMQLASSWTLQPRPAQAETAPLAPVKFDFVGPIADFSKVDPVIDTAALERDLMARRLLDGPEQVQGLWPAAPADLAPAADIPPPVQAALPAIGTDALAAGAPKQPDAGLATAPGATAVIGVADHPASGAIASTTDVANPALPGDTVKRAQPPRPHKKKGDWAGALFQNLFGN